MPGRRSDAPRPPSIEDALVRAALENAPDGIALCDAAGTIVLANRVLASLCGRPRSELDGVAVLSLAPGDALLEAELSPARRARVRTEPRTLGRVSLLRPDERRLVAEVAVARMTVGGRGFAVFTFRDVTERLREEQRLHYLGTHDALTDLYNRAFFEAELERLERGRTSPISVIVIDVNKLKTINDRLGHAAGDLHLRRLGTVLRSAFRAEDVVARIGGDEFVVLLPGVDAAGTAAAIERFERDVARHNEIAPHPLELAIGSATTNYPETLSSAIRVADQRMYARKRDSVRPPASVPGTAGAAEAPEGEGEAVASRVRLRVRRPTTTSSSGE